MITVTIAIRFRRAKRLARVSGEVGIARGCLGLRVAEQLADHRQAEAAGGGICCKGVAQVMDTNVV